MKKLLSILVGVLFLGTLFCWPVMAYPEEEWVIDLTLMSGMDEEEVLDTLTPLLAMIAPPLVEWQQENGYREICPFLPDHPTNGTMMASATGAYGLGVLIDGIPPPWRIWLKRGLFAGVACGPCYDIIHGCFRFRQNFHIKIILFKV